ncbi:MAG: PAS domain S-box protein [Phycisphaerales bacterium]|nr:MAG: PAS domain S-box protein [Phycisphaerales bacterium]
MAITLWGLAMIQAAHQPLSGSDDLQATACLRHRGDQTSSLHTPGDAQPGNNVRPAPSQQAATGFLAPILTGLSAFLPAGWRRSRKEKQKIQEALRLQALVFNNINDGVLVTDLNNRIIDCNPSAERLFGFSRSEILGKSPEVLNCPSQAQDITRKIQAGLRERGRWSGEVRFKRRDGTTGLCEASVVRLTGSDGGPVGTVSVNRDLTERSLAQDALRRTEERFRLVTTATQDAIYDWDILADTSWRNERYCQLFGPPLDSSYDWWCTQLHPHDRQIVVASLRKYLEGRGNYWKDEYRLRRADGGYADVMDRGFIVRDSSGRAVRMIGAMTDITERKHVEQALRQSEAKYRNLFENAEVAMYRSAIDGSALLAVNRKLAEFFECSMEELMARPAIERWLDPADREQMLRSVQPEGSLSHREIRVITKKGTVKTALASVKLYPEHGYLEGTAVDITEFRRAEAATRAAEKRLRMSERLAALGTFAAGTAHEINNPIGAMVLAAETALDHLEDLPADHPVIDLLKDVVRNGRHSGDVIRSILQFARQQPTDKWPTDLRTILERATRAVQDYARKNHVEMTLNLETDLPDIEANPVGMEQVFVNILKNAIEAGGRKAWIKTQLDDRPEVIQVEIGDDGCGIAPEHQTSLFDPFFTTRKKQGGTGLGLSIVHGIVSEHGGSVGIRSLPNHGTTVTVVLPLANTKASGADYVQSTGSR